ncbi:helix-turn-helix domain-containing protein [Aquamicrobium sp. NLF2-7]|uniref:helix-turn-helix domain-containing protein n=1 Tax=Aquamicrobium sp. NLF2-7 TaxID=2918753 RepID=UPI001EFC2543|nr:helix-turn-helix domain-containing protein [Aquamicrobium sp. NLF2-7]MCG8270339.1 helix-turn-helix domain-containing protein [Aquamicrobium sp. NLF2-7]
MSVVRQRFSIIPAMAVTDARLEPRDLQVLCLLGRHTDDLGWCCRSQVRMSRELNCGRATVQRALGRLMDAGYVEYRTNTRTSGADAAHDYRVVIDPPAAKATENTAQGVPTGGQGCPPIDGHRVPTHERAPMLTTPVKREERDARESEDEEDHADDSPRVLERRVKRLADQLRWPGWAKSSTAWTVAQFAALSADERAMAEERGAVYLSHCGRKALSLGVYFRERKFLDLPENVLKAAVEADLRKVAAPFGKLWNALRFAELFGPHAPLPKPSAFIEKMLTEGGEAAERMRRERIAAHGWPRVNDMHRAAESRRGWTVNASDLWLEDAAADFEQVKAGSELWVAWRQYHEQRGWPWLPDGPEWVWFPAGGPEQLGEFEAMINRQKAEAAE